jgi:hypothetical protein
MAKEDWGIVIGIQRYPAFDTDDERLRGPDNDAKAFRDWLVDKTGGDVPEGQVILITTSSFNPPFSSPSVAKPTEELIRMAIEDLQKIADQSSTGRIGRRLYLYMAGHGFASRENQTALLMANATKRNVGPPYHWLGEYTANWFCRAGYFDEIILFMDCCRDNYQVPQINKPWLSVTASDFSERVKRFYAFATRWGLKSRELEFNGVTHGIFTYELLEGLRGKASVPISGEHSVKSNPAITTESLKRYLMDAMKARQQLVMDSDFIYDMFEIAVLPPALYTYAITVHLPPGSTGKSLEIRNDKYMLIDETIAAPPQWQLSLEKGYYAVQIPSDNLQKLFAVNGTGAVDVYLQ